MTKILPVRVPWELYENILAEAVLHNLSISEWITLQITLVQNVNTHVNNIINDVASCRIIGCQKAQKFRNFLQTINSNLE